MLLDGVEGASLGSKFKHMKPGSKKKETITKKQEPLPIKEYVPKKQGPLPIKKYVPKKPLPIKEYVGRPGGNGMLFSPWVVLRTGEGRVACEDYHRVVCVRGEGFFFKFLCCNPRPV